MDRQTSYRKAIEHAKPSHLATGEQTPQSVEEEDAMRHVPTPEDQMVNLIRKCPKCDKSCGVIMLHWCNQCGTDISSVKPSTAPNVLMLIVRGRLQTGIIWQDKNLIVVQDPLSLAAIHFIVIPTKIYVSHVMQLFKFPREGLGLIQVLYAAAQDVIKEFWNLTNPNQPPADVHTVLENHTVIGFNYPPSQYQLHLQVIVGPLTMDHYEAFLKGNHFTEQRFFPYKFVHDALSKFQEHRSQPMETSRDLVSFMNTFGTVYTEEMKKLHKQVKRTQPLKGVPPAPSVEPQLYKHASNSPLPTLSTLSTNQIC